MESNFAVAVEDLAVAVDGVAVVVDILVDDVDEIVDVDEEVWISLRTLSSPSPGSCASSGKKGGGHRKAAASRLTRSSTPPAMTWAMTWPPPLRGRAETPVAATAATATILLKSIRGEQGRVEISVAIKEFWGLGEKCRCVRTCRGRLFMYSPLSDHCSGHSALRPARYSYSLPPSEHDAKCDDSAAAHWTLDNAPCRGLEPVCGHRAGSCQFLKEQVVP